MPVSFAAMEELLASHGSPVFFGVKPAALFGVPGTLPCDETLTRLLPNGDLRLLPMQPGGTRTLVMLYSESALRAALEDKQTKSILWALGYPAAKDLDNLLAHLRHRINQCRGFPHEIGFFLGYPFEDVIGFIRHKGSRYKYSGLWKVYGDVPRAKALFEQYSLCRKQLLAHIQSGGSLYRFCPHNGQAG